MLKTQKLPVLSHEKQLVSTIFPVKMCEKWFFFRMKNYFNRINFRAVEKSSHQIQLVRNFLYISLEKFDGGGGGRKEPIKLLIYEINPRYVVTVF